MRADLDALQAKLLDAALHLLDRQRRRLQRHRADAGVMARILAAELRGVIVQVAVQLERLARLRPVREEHGHGRDDLHIDAELRVIGDADLGIERVRPDFAEELAVLVDAVAALGLDHDREAVVAVLFGEVRPVGREDVGVGVDLEHSGKFNRSARAEPWFGSTPVAPIATRPA